MVDDLAALPVTRTVVAVDVGYSAAPPRMTGPRGLAELGVFGHLDGLLGRGPVDVRGVDEGGVLRSWRLLGWTGRHRCPALTLETNEVPREGQRRRTDLVLTVGRSRAWRRLTVVTAR